MKQYRIIEVKEGNKWIVSNTIENAAEIYETLARELLAKKVQMCKWITKITDRTNYDGTRKIVVTYDNGVRSIYQIADH